MYDRPALRAAHDRLWQAMDLGLDRTEPDDLWHHWHAPDLLFSQACVLPLAMGLNDHLHILGSPDFRLPDCPAGYYYSVVVTRADDPRDDLAAFADAPVAYNQPHSQSGWGALHSHAAARGVSFTNLIETGGHAASARALLNGTADLAAIDAHTFRLLAREDADMAGLRVLVNTDATPATPYVTALPARVDDLRKRLRAAIARLSDADRMTLGLYGFIELPPEAYLDISVPPRPWAVA